MEKEKIRNEIATLIESIREHSDILLGERHIPALQLELLLNKIEKLYERTVILNYLNSVSSGLTQPDLFSTLPPPAPSIATAPPAAVESTEEVPSLPPATNPASDTLSGKWRQQRIESIKSAIGINEKFRYINDLFEGKSQEYNAAITQLDNMSDPAEVTMYINTLKKLYNWNEGDEIVIHFMETIQRKFK